MNAEKNLPHRPGELDLVHMRREELEEVLIDTLIVKYPGIEQADIERLLHVLDTGSPEQIEQTEADIAEKSALWQRAVQALDDPADSPSSEEATD
jgi:hypothetical protein